MLACQADFGRVEHHEPGDLLKARVIVNWGKDIARTSIHLAAMVRQARKQGTRVLSISPGGDGHEAWTDAFIRVRPGQDRFLAARHLNRSWMAKPASDQAGRFFKPTIGRDILSAVPPGPGWCRVNAG